MEGVCKETQEGMRGIFKDRRMNYKRWAIIVPEEYNGCRRNI